MEFEVTRYVGESISVCYAAVIPKQSIIDSVKKTSRLVTV